MVAHKSVKKIRTRQKEKKKKKKEVTPFTTEYELISI